MKAIHFLFICAVLASALTEAQTNAVPFVNQPLVPMTVAPGGPSFTLTVNGTSFASGATVNWNSSALATTFVSSSQLAATVPAANIANPTTASVTVVNPAPGGGTSNVSYLGVTTPSANVEFTQYSEDFTFQGTVLIPVPYPDPAIADFNNDGKLDVAFIAFGSPSDLVCIELGNGDGSFQTPNCVPLTPPPPGNTPQLGSLVIADFNNDGKPDIAVSNQDGSDTISILLGNGDGTLQSAANYSTGANSPFCMVAADFNSDGRLDLAICGSGSGGTSNLLVLLGNGDGSFQGPLETALDLSPNALTVGDFNDDGKLDLAIYGGNFSGIYLTLGNGDGTFQAPELIATASEGDLQPAAAVDLNGDGELDLALVNYFVDNGAISLLFGNGDGTFKPMVSYSPAYPAEAGPLIADLNGDGYPDLVFTSFNQGYGGNGPSFLSAFYGSGNGEFGNEASFPLALTTGDPRGLVTGDFNGDGRTDALMVYQTGPGQYVTYFLFFVQGAFPALTPTPLSVSFGAQTLGTTSSPQAVTLTNTGLAELSLSGISVGGQNASDFGETNNCPPTLAVNATCQINVTFTPPGFSGQTALLQIAGNQLGGQQNVLLTGSGLGPAVSLSPPNLTFPGQYVGTSGLPQTVVVTNTGNTPLTISSVTTSPADFGVLSDCVNSVAPGASCAIGVFFDPTVSGARSGTLTINDNALNNPQTTMMLTGMGQDFSLGPSGPSSETVTPGGTAKYTLAIAPGGGFKQTVSLTCAGGPAGSKCSLSSSSVELSGSSPASVTVSVTTVGSSAALKHPQSVWKIGSLALWAPLCGWAGIVLLGNGRRKSKRGRGRFYMFLPCLLLIIFLAACGGGMGTSGASSTGGTGTGTPAGSYTVTVTGTFSSGSTVLTHVTNLELVVQ